MKILITGITGFVGSYLAHAWEGKFDKVIGIARHDRGLAFKNPVFYQDLAGDFSLEEPVDAIVHAAAQSPSGGAIEEDYVSSNVKAMRNLIKYALRHKVRKFINLSSISVYGEVSDDILTEDTPISNPDIYGITKYEAERLLGKESEKVPSVSLRLPGIVGRGARSCWVARTAAKMKKGEDISIYNPDSLFNNMVHLKDLESFITHLINSEWGGASAVNLGCNDPVTIRELAENLKSCLNSYSKIRVKKSIRSSFTISCDRACKIGYEPRKLWDILYEYGEECKNGR